MSLWSKIVIATKFMFGGFESATDYLLKILNDFIGGENVAGKVQKVREFVTTVLSYLKKYEKYCPAIWADDYLKLMGVIRSLVDMFEDGKVSAEEIKKAIAAVQAAIEEWNK